MKILRQLSPTAAPLAVAVAVLLSSGNLRASGPGGAGGNAGGFGGATAGGGAVASGGGHGGSAGGSGGHGAFSAPAVAGARSGVSFSNSGSRTSLGALSQGTSARTGMSSLASAPGTHAIYPAAGTTQALSQLPVRPTNAWSGTAINTARGSANSLYQFNGYTNNRFAGRVSANGYRNNIGGNGYRNGYYNGRYRFPYPYYNYPYGYGPYYAPYLGYYGGYAGAYPYYADGTYSDIANGSNGYGNGASTVAPQYTDQGQDGNDQQGPTQRQPAPQPAPQNQGDSGTAQGTVPTNGPDSLVEAVQQELIRRGYFGGKVDAMYGPDTKEALRKFQQDRHLADTGLINEATLHALQLD